jgi:hypothetical protein
MRIHFVALSLACLWGLSIRRATGAPAPAEPQQAEAIDFDALRAQATAALETLRQSQERHLASAVSTEF